MTLYLAREQILRIHERQTERFGGSAGIRDRGALDAAIARPQSTFDGEDLYPDLSTKAATLLHSSVANYPFLDGNKRTATMSAELFLLFNGYKVIAGDGELETITMATARGEVAAEELAIWIRQRIEMIEV